METPTLKLLMCVYQHQLYLSLATQFKSRPSSGLSPCHLRLVILSFSRSIIRADGQSSRAARTVQGVGFHSQTCCIVHSAASHCAMDRTDAAASTCSLLEPFRSTSLPSNPVFGPLKSASPSITKRKIWSTFSASLSPKVRVHTHHTRFPGAIPTIAPLTLGTLPSNSSATNSSRA